MSHDTQQLMNEAIIRHVCPVIPSRRHCWHEQLGLWEDLFPPGVVCCWCGIESRSMHEVPTRHGPHVPKE